MSTLNVSNISDGTTTVGTGYVVNGSAKAWVNFNGTGTIAARDSLNLSSLTDHGTGQYGITVSSSFANANYAGAFSYGTVYSSGASDVGASNRDYSIARTTSNIRYALYTSNGGAFADTLHYEVMLMGDLA